jgi:hypothetical protein
MGGCCAICSYDRTVSALELHHLDPTAKDFALGTVRRNPASWPKIVAELKKCVLLCANCHREVHDGILDVPENPPSFDERFADYKSLYAEEPVPCPICSGPKPAHQITCSVACAGQRKGKVDWDSVDLPNLMSRLSMVKIAEMLGCSDVAVKKRWKKISH